jgi:MoaA/NifB/PqqE/SkfB family radical SAM enzyme
MRDDIFELIDYAKWFVTRLNTNGIKLTDDYCRSLKNASIDSVQITFYSSDEEVHNKLVGAQRYKDTVAGIENALNTGLNISINTPLCTLNKDYVSTLKFLHEKGVSYVTCSGLITTGNAALSESEDLQLSHEEIRQILKESVEYCFANGMEISFTPPGWVDADYCNELGITTPSCGACLSNMAVTPGGNVVPCQSWLSGDVLGNILKDEWDEIWNSEECSKRREYSASQRCECPLRIVKGVK